MPTSKCGVEIKQVATILLDEIMSKLCSKEISQQRFEHILGPIEYALVHQRMKGARKVLESFQICSTTVQKILDGG